MSKYIPAYDMLCFLSCTCYSLWVYQCSLVYRFMINLFSIYKKALLIPRSGLDELPDAALLGLLIYWNDLQLSPRAFPEHNTNQLLMNEVSERQGQSGNFWDLGQGWSPSQREIVSGGKLPVTGTAAALSREMKEDRLCLHSHQNMQGHHARPNSCSLQSLWGARGYRQLRWWMCWICTCLVYCQWKPQLCARTAFAPLLRLKEAFMLHDFWLSWCLLSRYSSAIMYMGWNFRHWVAADWVRRQSWNLSKTDLPLRVLCH